MRSEQDGFWRRALRVIGRRPFVKALRAGTCKPRALCGVGWRVAQSNVLRLGLHCA
jgi:hypothetical protein